jgi:hypothetical protein
MIEIINKDMIPTAFKAALNDVKTHAALLGRCFVRKLR